MTRPLRAYALAVAAVAALVYALASFLHKPTRILVVTPTRDDLTRYPSLLYMAHALAHSNSAKRITWIVLEDAPELDPSVAHLLKASALDHRYMTVRSTSKTAHRGIPQRNAALELIKAERMHGLVYFADDDNAYRPSLWSHLRDLPADSFTIFSVGNTGYMGFESAVLEPVSPSSPPPAASVGGADANLPSALSSSSLSPANSDLRRISQWTCDFCPRRWNVDMSGFAFHSSLLHAPAGDALAFNDSARIGFLETEFLQLLEKMDESSLVVIPDLLDEVHVWHNFASPFRNAAFYDSDWKTSATFARKPANETDLARGFSWADEDLPLATVLRRKNRWARCACDGL
ncbi:hypothetical protein JCM10207_001342 [Rhodosporidiobolus poonsookiae]